MKKIVIYIFFLMIICFAIPAIFVKTFQAQETSIEAIEDASSIVEYDYGNYDKVILLHKKTNEIEELKLDEYLYGVVAAEMPVDFDIEALKAQAVVARTYTMYKIINNPKKHENADICDDSTCCQAWISKFDRFSKWEERQARGKLEQNSRGCKFDKGTDYYL